jgi:membrane-bound lytic murein transglycosylase D
VVKRALIVLAAASLTACAPPLRTFPAPVSAPAAARGAGPAPEHVHGPAVAPSDRVDAAEESVVTLASQPGTDAAELLIGDAPRWDIEVASYETHARVEHYVRLFSGTARDRIADRLSRGTQYEPMIRARLREAGLPEDMYYLALIESGFDVDAYSRAAAVGMWQFMTATARGMGLRVDWWVDERRDPVRSTDGAVRFLAGLRQQFGSLYLAAAAYNGGPGRISRGLQRFSDDLEGTVGDDLFFALTGRSYLHRETEDYVPQLIAAAIVGKEPHRYGMHVESRPPFAYDSVSVTPTTPVATVADAANADLAAVRELNPHLLRGITPAGSNYWVRVPVGHAEGFDEAFAALPESERVGIKRVTISKIQSVAELASQHGISARNLTAFNPALKRTPKGNVAAGQTVMVPTAASIRGARDVPDPAIEIYGSATRTAARRTHVVKKGETLSHIARQHGTSVDQLMKLNRLKQAMIFPGQELAVSGSTPAATRKPAASAARPAANPPARKPAAKAPAQKPAAKAPAQKPAAKAPVSGKASGG